MEHVGLVAMQAPNCTSQAISNRLTREQICETVRLPQPRPPGTLVSFQMPSRACQLDRLGEFLPAGVAITAGYCGSPRYQKCAGDHGCDYPPSYKTLIEAGVISAANATAAYTTVLPGTSCVGAMRQDAVSCSLPGVFAGLPASLQGTLPCSIRHFWSGTILGNGLVVGGRGPEMHMGSCLQTHLRDMARPFSAEHTAA